MARHHDRKSVLAQRAPHGPRRTGLTDLACDLAVGGRGARNHATCRGVDGDVEGRDVAQVESDRCEIVGLATEQRRDATDGDLGMCGCVADTNRCDETWELPWEVPQERRARGAIIGPGELHCEERVVRPGHSAAADRRVEQRDADAHACGFVHAGDALRPGAAASAQHEPCSFACDPEEGLTMRGAIFDQHGLAVRDDIEVRAPTAGEVVVRIHAAGVCHSDSKVLSGATAYPLPVVLGHEGAGIVDSVGPGVTSVGVGDHVVLHTLRACGMCAACASGMPTRCRQSLGVIDAPFRIGDTAVHQFANTSVFVERTVVSAGQVVRISDAIPMPVAALLGCGVITGTGAVFNRAKVRPGESVVVIGAGGVGLNAVQAARISGASQIVAVDTNASKEPIARLFGATDFVEVHDTVTADVLDVVHGGADHVIVCIGSAPLVRLAVDLLAPGGQAVIVGFPGGGAQASFDMATLYQEKSILACRYGSSSPQRDVPFLARLYAEGRLMLDELVTRTMPLDQVADAFASMAGGATDARSVLTLV
jgi:Zn-dependent alcohol dehydrogenase